MATNTLNLSLLSDAELRAAFWTAQREALASFTTDPMSYGAAVARKSAILAEQRSRRAAR